jgi:hypothetical protein
MSYRQNSLLTLSILIVLVHFLFSGYPTQQNQSCSEKVVIHVSPDYPHQEVVKPSNVLSLFVGKVQVDSILKWVSQIDWVNSTIKKYPNKFSLLTVQLIPIFLSYRVIRI